MTATSSQITDPFASDRENFTNRLLADALGAFNIFSIYIGDQLGFYQELAKGSGLTPPELARHTHTNERYVREWLEHQAAGCILEVEMSGGEDLERRYRLPPARAEILADHDSLSYMAPLAQLIVGATHPLETLIQAYRDGGGVPYRDYGLNLRDGQASMNRPMFLNQLGTEWLPAIPDVHARLRADPPARVADIGCGAGWSCIGIARSYPRVQVDGYDLDESSIQMAQANIQQAGLAERVHAFQRDAGDKELQGHYDLVVAIECLHDMSDPVGALRTMRGMAGEQGSVLIVDERALDAFQPCAETLEQLLYGFSILHCLPAGMAEQPSAATGTVMRPDTLKRYAAEAGFKQVEILPIDHFFFRFYRLHP